MFPTDQTRDYIEEEKSFEGSSDDSDIHSGDNEQNELAALEGQDEFGGMGGDHFQMNNTQDQIDGSGMDNPRRTESIIDMDGPSDYLAKRDQRPSLAQDVQIAEEAYEDPSASDLTMGLEISEVVLKGQNDDSHPAPLEITAQVENDRLETQSPLYEKDNQEAEPAEATNPEVQQDK